MSRIFNPKFQTKNIYNINPGISGIPSEGEIFQWFTVQNDIIYNNFRINGQQNDRKYPVQATVSPEEGSSSSSQYSIDLSGFLTDESITFDTTNDTITFSVNEATDKVVSIPAIYKRHVVSGAYSSSTKYLTLTNNDNTTVDIDLSDIVSNDESQKYVVSGAYDTNSRSIIFTYNDNNTFSVDLSSIVVDNSSSSSMPAYSFANTDSISFTINDSLVSADVNISNDNDNLLSVKNNGLYVQRTNKYLLFKVPEIEDSDEFYHLFIDFSQTDDFNIVYTYSSLNNPSLFKVFTGLGIIDFPNNSSSSSSGSESGTGLNNLFSRNQLQFALVQVLSSHPTYKYFRYHWTNDDGDNFGPYGYGSADAQMQMFDDTSKYVVSGSYSSTTQYLTLTNSDNSTVNIDLSEIEGSGGGSSTPSTPNNELIEFTSSNSTGVLWNGNVATFTHSLDCIPVVTLYNNTLNQILCEVNVLSASTFSIDFVDKSVITGTWKLIVGYGASYQTA